MRGGFIDVFWMNHRDRATHQLELLKGVAEHLFERFGHPFDDYGPIFGK
jgi:hypothetical protein